MVVQLGFYSSTGVLELRDVIAAFREGLFDGIYVTRSVLPSALFLGDRIVVFLLKEDLLILGHYV